MGRLLLSLFALSLGAAPLAAQRRAPKVPIPASPVAAPLTIGETFTIASTVLRERRRINVYAARGGASPADPLPVMYMPDGGIAEDFLHVAGLLQVLVGNGTMRPFLLVGIENTERRRDMTGPTSSADDRKIAPRVGGSAAFRTFLRRELMPAITARYRSTSETAIVGESLAGLFVVETFLLEPALFDHYIAFDPSLWWDSGRLVRTADSLITGHSPRRVTLYLAGSADMDRLVNDFSNVLRTRAYPGLQWQYVPMPEETHATIYHPAALRAFRALFKPVNSK